MLLRVILAVEDGLLRDRVRGLLAEQDVLLSVLPGSQTSWETLQEWPSDVLIVSRRIIPDPAVESISRFADLPNSSALVVLFAEARPSEHMEFRAAGAEAALGCDVPDATLAGALAAVMDATRALLSKTLVARRTMVVAQLTDFVSSSPAMQRFMKTVFRVVDSDAPLLITGETGVGKERLARAIHNASRRMDGPFISINCGAIPEHLLESQLFGHERGSFTGAAKTQRGCFELAHNGSLFLDEIGEMPPHLQVKLLQVLQDYHVRPIGAEQTIPVNVRVIAATNKEIAQEVESRRFRQDLYYRLSVLSLEVPPLRQRVEDIPALAESFAEDLSRRVGRKKRAISPEAMRLLCDYAWPGNVRELINVLERVILLCEDDCIRPEDLPQEFQALARQDAAAGDMPDWSRAFPAEWVHLPLEAVREKVVESVEKAYLVALLRANAGRIGETARQAGIEPRWLFSKMKRYGLRKEDFKPEKNRPVANE